ncbi:MAG TPA: phosphogluconate dehydrogenase (NADP(+)-dependent, decarboxylating) [Planctomycetaceae bacterium]|jgi:6-phosphogluconate dehydrogenase|nr:phosphogluconate dehydrogenase (NADP(+)-dependent, decarboxylating) [Planctomycetaceae bacterium]HCK72806.1 phosphogluconate dehydrogenase (NADP(+)-dependent, decarboxylating) [Planctomycetaceae bacterium]HCP85459.1 phosphogluconate dehydrogenase (NADP(+)-dependent, decarboxylating) [Planctomycetaceae bacterium]|tara:strand:- start:726 stop:2180 length:1455 start_codon:yes stop_codon:yes gene_type:complete
MSELADFGLIGLAVMGENLALNVESRGYKMAVFNRTTEKVDNLINGRAAGKNFVGCHSVEELVQSLASPRKVMMLVKAGPAVDALIDQLIPLLEEGDIIIDGGNTHFTDTERRTTYVEEQGLLYVGTGVSGGEEGALKGPSMMPGGSEEGWAHVEPIFKAIAAKVGPENDIPCCEWVGPRGAGHYVKMVHNGIEYGDMQLICEAYQMLKDAVGLNNDEMYDVFAEWNRGDLQSYLIEITRDIFSVKDDESDGYLVDMILDRAGAKGTGKWMSQLALDLGVPSTLVTTAVYARSLSSLKDSRVKASTILGGPDGAARDISEDDKAQLVEDIRQALYASKICSYAQGFVQLQHAAAEHDWPLNYGECALLWRGGCIIRAQFLDRIKEAFDAQPDLENLLLYPYFTEAVHAAQASWRRVVMLATELGIPVPAFSTALAYYDSIRREVLPANLLQAQRDYFGAHTFERTDKEGWFHAEWIQRRREPQD